MQVWKVEYILKENFWNEDVIIREMTRKMKVKFDKYWKHYSDGLAFGVKLDLQVKNGFIKYCYTNLML